MAINFDIRTVESSEAVEVYISAFPTARGPLEEQAGEMFSGIRDILISKKACIFQERVFATQHAMESVSKIRSQVYHDIDDGVPPSYLVCKEGILGPFAAVQVHAVCGQYSKEIVYLDQIPCGRVLRTPSCHCLSLSNLSALQLSGQTKQAHAMFEKANSLLKQFGSNFNAVARTWMWLRDIISWYDDFNSVRNEFFTERSILGEHSDHPMPASTGIGLDPNNGCSCSMDMIATLKPADSIQFFQALGKQQSAFDYGSAFSRCSRTVTPAGETVFVSGTASIDSKGDTTNIGDAPEQINATIENVRAVLRDVQYREEDIVQGMAYCKTTEVEKIFNKVKKQLGWPCVTIICDVCRDDLLFEIEVTAMRCCLHDCNY